MDPFQNLKSLQERKQKLLLECEVNRQVLGLEAEIIRLRMSQWKGSLSALPETWKVLAPLGGFLMTSRFKGRTMRLLAATALGVVAFTRLRDLWQIFGGKKKKGNQESVPAKEDE